MHRSLVVAMALVLGSVPAALAEGERIVQLEVVERQVTGDDLETAGGFGVLRLTQGDSVELRWTTDEATELHLHGYDITIDVPTRGEAVMSFEARATGRFAVESHGFGDDHHAEKTLLYIEVHPR